MAGTHSAQGEIFRFIATSENEQDWTELLFWIISVLLWKLSEKKSFLAERPLVHQNYLYCVEWSVEKKDETALSQTILVLGLQTVTTEYLY